MVLQCKPLGKDSILLEYSAVAAGEQPPALQETCDTIFNVKESKKAPWS